MTSRELDLIASQIEDLDSTDLTQDENEDESTDLTQDDEEIRLDADATELTMDKFGSSDADATELTKDSLIGTIGNTKLPASEIHVRDLAIESTAPLAALPAESDAAFGQWLAGSGLSRH
jgi:hypothetical protein